MLIKSDTSGIRTHARRLVPKTSALDRSAIVSLLLHDRLNYNINLTKQKNTLFTPFFHFMTALLFLMFIEPLGSLLRQHEEYDVCFTDDHTATVSSLLMIQCCSPVRHQTSRPSLTWPCCTMTALKQAQPRQIQAYAPQPTIDPIRLPGARVIQRGETVTFQGILFKSLVI